MRNPNRKHRDKHTTKSRYSIGYGMIFFSQRHSKKMIKQYSPMMCASSFERYSFNRKISRFLKMWKPKPKKCTVWFDGQPLFEA